MLFPSLRRSLTLALAALLLPPASGSLGAAKVSTAELSSVAFVKVMGLGWNLGNTLEAIPKPGAKSVRDCETAWGNPEAKRALFAAIKAAGFSSVRIPVAWSNLMGPGYAISPELLKRVGEVLDMAQAEGLVAIVNIHWDGGWWSKFPSQPAESMKRYRRLWSQIAEAFKDRPASALVFESLNEEGCFNEVWDRYKDKGDRAKAYAILNDINQAFVDLLRKSGGANAKRHLLIAGYATDIALTVHPLYRMPKDPAGRCMLSVHYYDPFVFAGLTKDESWGKARRTWGSQADLAELDAIFEKLKLRFVDKGVPVIVGEYGSETVNKDPDSVRRYLLAVAAKVRSLGACPMLWDPGTHFDRQTLAFKDKKLAEGYRQLLIQPVESPRQAPTQAAEDYRQLLTQPRQR